LIPWLFSLFAQLVTSRFLAFLRLTLSAPILLGAASFFWLLLVFSAVLIVPFPIFSPYPCVLSLSLLPTFIFLFCLFLPAISFLLPLILFVLSPTSALAQTVSARILLILIALVLFFQALESLFPFIPTLFSYFVPRY
jgi:hypothetical protein